MKRISGLLFSLLLLTLLFALSCGAQDGTKSSETVNVSGEGYASVLYNSSNGLPTSESNTVLQTSNGFIWIGCYCGLKGDQIPMIAQIIAVADTFDAMYSTRPYRKQMDIRDVLAELKRVSGTQLNGDIVNCLVQLVDEGEIQQVKL